MGSVDDAYDNAKCESFFATLECELLDRTCFRNQAEARMETFNFIEGWYNPQPRHSAPGLQVTDELREGGAGRRLIESVKPSVEEGQLNLSLRVCFTSD